jgi:hypothetical protein
MLCHRFAEAGMNTEFCDRYRERNASNPRQMLALRTAEVDLSKWELISFGATPPSKLKALIKNGFVILDAAAEAIRRRVA